MTAIYGGKLIDFDGHMSRLSNTLEAISIPNPHDVARWTDIHTQLISRNQLSEGLVYLEVSAGTLMTAGISPDQRYSRRPYSCLPTIAP